MGEDPPATPGKSVRKGYRVWWWYSVAAVLRIAAVLLPGYVHPDEFFQSTEVAASDLLSLGVQAPWEFDRSNPCRSSLVPFLTAGLPYQGLYQASLALNIPLSPLGMLLAPRFTACAASFLLDWCTWRLANACGSHQPSVIIALATAWPTLLLSTRPTSNALEALVFAMSLTLAIAPPRRFGQWTFSILAVILVCVCVSGIADTRLLLPLLLLLAACIVLSLSDPLGRQQRWGVSLVAGALICVGIFIRFTLVLFTLPLVMTPLLSYIPEASSSRVSFLRLRNKRTPQGAGFSMMPMVVGFVAAGLGAVQVDSVYFGAGGFGPLLRQVSDKGFPLLHVSTWADNASTWADSIGRQWSSADAVSADLRSNLVLAPINSFLYNANAKNLEQHGIHPHVTHALINMPMLYGPLALVAGYHLFKRTVRERERGGLFAFHRWARFMVAACSLCGLIGLSLAPHQEPRFLLPLAVPMCVFFGHVVAARGGEAGVTRTWLLFNATLLVFFGLFHQGGVTRAAVGLNSVPEGGRVVWWKTYMPPVTSLLQAPAKSKGSKPWKSVDVMGGSGQDLFNAVAKLSSGGRVVYVVSPGASRAEAYLPPMCSVIHSYFPHLSTENLPDLKVGNPLDLFSLQVFQCGKVEGSRHDFPSFTWESLNPFSFGLAANANKDQWWSGLDHILA